MDNDYKQNVINIIDTFKELVIKELNTDLSTQEYDSLCSYLEGLTEDFQIDLAQGVVYAGK